MLRQTAIIVIPAHLLLAGCANFGLGQESLSSTLELRPVESGFTATTRAGVDRLANDPTWETIRRQDLAAAVKLAGICPNGIGTVERKATIVRSIEIGTSHDLTYAGRCK